MDDAREQPSFTMILDWLEGRLDPAATDVVARSVAAGDERTSRTLEWLRGFIETAQGHPLHQPPALVRQRLRHHFAEWSRTRLPTPRAPEEFGSSLLFDSRHDFDLVGVRAVDDADEILHLAYTSEVADLVIDAARTEPGRLRVLGQVLPLDPTSAPIFEALIVGEDFTGRTVDGDDTGRFAFDDVPETVSTLRVSNGEFIVEVELGLT